MNQIEVPRAFNMTFSELMSATKKLIVVLERDLSDLGIFGLTQANIDNLVDLVDDFEDMRTDIEYEGDLMVKTQEKDVLAEQVKEQIRFMNVRVEAAFGANSIVYDTFRFGDYNKIPDDALLTTIQRVTRMANQYIAELGTYGVTPALITQLDTLSDQFSDAIVAQEGAVDARRMAANDRTIAANEIYTFVTNYSNFGKKFYAKTNPAKYEDYVIYTTTSPGSLTAPQNFMFDPVNYDFSWSAVENATSYILQESTDGTNWTEYWSGAETTCAYEESPVVMMYFRVLAHNAGGNSAPSNTLTYDFAPTLVAPGSFHYNPETYYFTWTAVPNAEYYEFQYRAQTNPTWNSLNAGNATSFLHADPVGNYLARVRAVSGSTMGPWSIELEYTVGPIQPN